jgi:hypothetical protein
VQPQVGSSNGSNGSSGGSGDDGSSGSSDGSSGGSSTGGGSSGVLRFKVLEGLVPGLDFANHSLQVSMLENM